MGAPRNGRGFTPDDGLWVVACVPWVRNEPPAAVSVAAPSSTRFSPRRRCWCLLVPLRLRHTDPGLLRALPQHGARVRGRRSRGSSWLPAQGVTEASPPCSGHPRRQCAQGGTGPAVSWAPRVKSGSNWSRGSHLIRNHSSGGCAVISLTGWGICSCRVDDLGESVHGTQPLASDDRVGPLPRHPSPSRLLCESPRDRSCLPISLKAHGRAPVTWAPGPGANDVRGEPAGS